MPTAYETVKFTAIDIVDDFSVRNVFSDYGSKYSAKTKLNSLGINPAVLAVMPPRFNKRMSEVVGNSWNNVGPIDLVKLSTVGDIILIACGQSIVDVPDGEPV